MLSEQQRDRYRDALRRAIDGEYPPDPFTEQSLDGRRAYNAFLALSAELHLQEFGESVSSFRPESVKVDAALMSSCMVRRNALLRFIADSATSFAKDAPESQINLLILRDELEDLKQLVRHGVLARDDGFAEFSAQLQELDEVMKTELQRTDVSLIAPTLSKLRTHNTQRWWLSLA